MIERTQHNTTRISIEQQQQQQQINQFIIN
mgnify:CR=1 FL=1